MGDVVGSIYEFNPPHEEKQIEIFSGISFVTDDSILMLAIGEYIVDGRKKPIQSYFKDYHSDTYEEMLAKIVRLKNDTDTCTIIASQFFSCYDNRNTYKDFINTKLDDFLKSKVDKIQKEINLNE
jgi:ADP-ribosylglycohydrolase